jgi:hypothetical protein
VFDIPTTAIFFNSRILRISDGECESVFIAIFDYLIKQLSSFNVNVNIAIIPINAAIRCDIRLQ